MKKLASYLSMCTFLLISGICQNVCAKTINQTNELSSINLPTELPYTIKIDVADFSLPNGIHSCVSAKYDGKWLMFSGRTNGLHGFESDDNNFPPSAQNTFVYVIDPLAKTVVSKSFSDISSGLNQHQIDLLSVTSPEFYRKGDTLYVTGGYGVDTATGNFSTKDSLSAVNVPGLIHWVTDPSPGETAAQHIRQISNPIVQVTGGYLTEGEDGVMLLIFGQNFKGFYSTEANGNYTEQVRRFKIRDNGVDLSIKVLPPFPNQKSPHFRRRDLNVFPIVSKYQNKLHGAFVALSGVFTKKGGIWTVPVNISEKGETAMANPHRNHTFKQGMNNYICSNVGLYSKKHEKMFILLLGGISFGYLDNYTFETDPLIPFINQITTVEIDHKNHFKQYIMDEEFPVIYSTFSNPGNRLLFGAASTYFSVDDLPAYSNGVVKYDHLGNNPLVIGYIVGGIQSTLPNTNTQFDSAASPFIFTLTMIPK